MLIGLKETPTNGAYDYHAMTTSKTVKMKRLTNEQKQFYEQNGFLKLDNILSSLELDELSTSYNQLFESKNNEDIKALWQGDWQEKFEVGSGLHVQSIHNLQMHSSVFTRLLMNQNLLDAVEDIMGTENIVLHHTKAHLKPPENGAPFPMHQDYHYFPYEKDSMIAIFVHLDDTNVENGGLAIFPGSHKLGPLEDKSDKVGFHYVDQDQFDISKAVPVEAKKGEIVIFSYLLVHGSFVNMSDRTRRMFLIQLASADDKSMSEMHRSPCNGLVLRGSNQAMEASLAKRHETFSENDANFNYGILQK